MPDPNAPTFQENVFRLKKYWSDRGCIIQEPYDVEVGAGTSCPETFLRALGPQPWRTAYVQPSRRPADGRYGDNPNRLYKHMQLQVILKPTPEDDKWESPRSEEHTSELQSHVNLVCRLLLEKRKKVNKKNKML